MIDARRSDLFRSEQGEPRIVHGVTILTNATRLAELAGRIGYQTIWIEVEHGTAGFVEVEALCVAAEAGGAAPTVRIPDNSRENVLRAMEAGARVLVVPNINSAADAEQIVCHGKFPPAGRRGYNTRTRGVFFGLQSPRDIFQRANEESYLFAQIETRQGVENVEAICSVEGLAGVLIGPGDLSLDYGKPGQFGDPQLISTVVTCIQHACRAGKHAGIVVASQPMLSAAIDAGCDLVFAGGDVQDLAEVWTARLRGFTQ